MILCLWQLGSTGLIDETPPLFAAAGRAMSTTGNWLTPKVNGLDRFDKPPLVYWLMGVGYSLPGQSLWDPLGTWAARLPSALSTLLMVLVLGDTVMCWPKEHDPFPRRTAVGIALAFALSPLVMIWSRIAVSDALLCSTLGISLLLQWRRYADPIRHPWWLAWLVLGFAVLTKGPVALVLTAMIIILFGLHQGDFAKIWTRLKPVCGLLITALISLPWYLTELLVEGKPFWDSFFGYHNFQRFTSVVNSHSEPWWFFLLVLIVASLPFTPLLFLGLIKSLSLPFDQSDDNHKKPDQSLFSFAACWLLAILLFFTCAATKLPSYWLPATPAAAILIGWSGVGERNNQSGAFFSWLIAVLFAFFLALIFCLSPLWIGIINDPEMPTLAMELFNSNLLIRAAFYLFLTAIFGSLLLIRKKSGKLIAMQIPLIFFQLFVLFPIWTLADKLRQLPLRQAAQLMVESKKEYEPFAMVGAVKPSLHFYTDEMVIYEGRSPRALVNLVDRLNTEKRQGWQGKPVGAINASRTALVVIDKDTIQKSHWKDLDYEVLGKFSIYIVLRIDRLSLESRSKEIVHSGFKPNWRLPRPERF